MKESSSPTVDDYKALIEGIKANMPAKTSIVLLGQPYTAAELTEAFQARVDKGATTVTARTTYRTAVKEEHVSAANVRPLRQAFRAHITSQLGAESEELTGYGFKPRSTKKLPVAAKAQAAEQAVATRKARNPLTKEEKKRIKGVVATPVAAAPAAAVATPAPSTTTASAAAAPQVNVAPNGTTQANGGH